MHLKQNLITKKQELLKLTTLEIESLVVDSLGIKVEVLKTYKGTFILLQSYHSCFRLMEKLHWDFDFSVHKKNNKYIIEL